MMHKGLHIGFALALTALTAGCATHRQPDPAFAPTRPPNPKPSERITAPSTRRFAMRLFEDQRARRVGDILTITLAETTTASKKADTTSKKKDDVDLKSPTLLGSSVGFQHSGRIPQGRAPCTHRQ